MTMRVNAPLTAILALAAVSLSSTPLHARPTTRLPAKPRKTHIQETVPPQKHLQAHSQTHSQAHGKKHSGKTTPPAKSTAKPAPKHHRKHRETVDDNIPATITRIKAAPHATEPRTEPKTGPRKATSADFLHAATTDLVPQPESAQPEAVQPESVAKSVSVVGVIRPDTQHPALQPVEEEASTPVILPSLYNKRGRLIVPRALKGSHEILLRQNQVADREGLDRIRDDQDILDLRSQNLLVALPTGNDLTVDERLPEDRRYCRPWTAEFLSTLSRSYYERFHTPLQVNSAVRTVEFQQRLLRTNGNAAPAEGDTASPHLTGQAVDLAKHGLTLTQIAWLRGYLLPLVQQGKVDVEEEFKQACFHISVYKKYLPPGSVPRRNLASSHRAESSALATAIQ
jgi:hypothetical protein